MQRLLAVLLILIGLIGLVLGRLGETTWAPATETTATVQLSDPGPAVVIDPGVLYVGAMEGEVSIEGASDVSVITAANSDIEAYLDDTKYTRITGASDWTTLSTQEVNPDGAAELTDPTDSDLWRSVDSSPSPYTLDVAEFAAAEHGENEQVYRAILIVTDGTEAGADSVSITWPVEDENEWVPYSYAGGAAIAVIGLVLFVVSIGRRPRDVEDIEVSDADDHEDIAAAAAVSTGPGIADSADDGHATNDTPIGGAPTDEATNLTESAATDPDPDPDAVGPDPTGTDSRDDESTATAVTDTDVIPDAADADGTEDDTQAPSTRTADAQGADVHNAETETLGVVDDRDDTDAPDLPDDENGPSSEDRR